MLETKSRLTPEEEQEKRIRAAADDISGARKIFEKRRTKEGAEAAPLGEFVVGEKREANLDLLYETVTEADPQTAKSFEKIARYNSIMHSLDYDELGNIRPIALIELDEQGEPTPATNRVADKEIRRRAAWKENASQLKEESIEDIKAAPKVAELLDADAAGFFIDLIQERDRLEAEFLLLLRGLEKDAEQNGNKAPENLQRLAAVMDYISKYREILLQKKLTKKMTESMKEKNEAISPFIESVMAKYHEVMADFIGKYVRNKETENKPKKEAKGQKSIAYKSAGAYTIYMTQSPEDQAKDADEADFIKSVIGRGQKGGPEVKVPLFKTLAEEFGLPYPDKDEVEKRQITIQTAQKSFANQLYIAIDGIDQFRQAERETEAMPRRSRRAGSK